MKKVYYLLIMLFALTLGTEAAIAQAGSNNRPLTKQEI